MAEPRHKRSQAALAASQWRLRYSTQLESLPDEVLVKCLRSRLQTLPQVIGNMRLAGRLRALEVRVRYGAPPAYCERTGKPALVQLTLWERGSNICS